MSKLLVLIANSSRAKLYHVKGRGKEIQKTQEIDYPNGRKKEGELNTDRPGRTFDRIGPGRHAVGTEVDPNEHEQKVFASNLSDILQKGLEQKEFDEIALIAPPQFLGALRQALSDQLKKHVTQEVDKDIVSSPSEGDCIDLMCRYLDLWNR